MGREERDGETGDSGSTMFLESDANRMKGINGIDDGIFVLCR
jgi:hypothetical protein